MVGQIRAELEHELSIPDKSLFLMNLSGAAEFKQVLPDEKSLRDLGLKPGDRAGIELRINYYQEQVAEEYVMPDCLELKVMNDRGEERIISVHVQRPVMDKPYFGGYRNKMTGATYHHAVTQTAPIQKKDVHIIRFHREAQTYEYRTRSTQCKREAGTQMEKVGLYVDQRDDVVMKPRRPYFSSADKAFKRTRQLRQARQVLQRTRDFVILTAVDPEGVLLKLKVPQRFLQFFHSDAATAIVVWNECGKLRFGCQSPSEPFPEDFFLTRDIPKLGGKKWDPDYRPIEDFFEPWAQQFASSEQQAGYGLVSQFDELTEPWMEGGATFAF
ncbi:unnamed protein product [Durusdinium trenchii]|uniref:Ubiquitin-like domain-containing protein n=1 Tax=Durusdinium trenchii TaxID=1381693 RepID=A0ABP0NEJ6_9DINO